MFKITMTVKEVDGIVGFHASCNGKDFSKNEIRASESLKELICGWGDGFFEESISMESRTPGGRKIIKKRLKNMGFI